MDSYYQKLVDQEIERIRKRTVITVYEGHTITTLKDGVKTSVTVPESAIEAATRENTERNALARKLEQSVAVDPATGRAHDLDFLAQHCRDIYVLPTSPRAIEIAIHVIGDSIGASNYPNEDRERVINILTDLRMHGHFDTCFHNQVCNAIRGARSTQERLALA